MNNEISICLSGKDELCDAGEEKRIENPGDKREQEKKYDRWFYLVPDYEGDGSWIHTIPLTPGLQPVQNRECYCPIDPDLMIMKFWGLQTEKQDSISGYHIHLLVENLFQI